MKDKANKIAIRRWMDKKDMISISRQKQIERMQMRWERQKEKMQEKREVIENAMERWEY